MQCYDVRVCFNGLLYLCCSHLVNNTQVACVNCMDNFFGQNDYFTVFIETGPLLCGDNYVDLNQPLICVAHDTNLFVLPASIMRCLFTYVGLLLPVYSCRLDQKFNENCL